ncbi:MAG: DUF5018 domain-containing protein [Bacteroidota bacterium]
MKKINILFLSLFVLAACSGDDDENTGGAMKSDAKQITTFTFREVDNNDLDEDISATIDKEEKTITASVPFGTDVSALKPTLTISEKATVNPKDKAEVDFNDKVEFTVTAEDGSTQKYAVTMSVGKSSAKAILSFVFRAEDNEALEEGLEANIDEEERKITPTWGSASFLPELLPTIEISRSATISPKPGEVTDFTEPVEYTVTAEDGSTEKYTLSFAYRDYTQKEILTAFYKANPNNKLGWDVEEDDLSKWKGVTLRDNVIVALDIGTKNLSKLSPELTLLTKLEELHMDFNTEILEIPKEIARWTKLKIWKLYGNSIPSGFPDEIAQLKSLETLSFGDANITELPNSFVELSPNLKFLGMSACEFVEFPVEVFELKNLEFLGLSHNSFAVLPEGWENLENLRELNIRLNAIQGLPQDLCQLIAKNDIKVDKDAEVADCPQ